ncbi:phage holin family protein [Micromonospora sp. NPDC049679]|uniref:phage holin family protein n=1 Tax=Micromonospora sp. NPDC049679 TaxID=3155920 RepID=UPI0033C245ED
MGDVPNGSQPRHGADVSAAELVQRATDQISRLVREELSLARAELTEKGKKVGVGAGLFGGGGALAFYGGGALITAVVLVLAEFMPAWVAALVVGIVLIAVAGLLALSGKKQVSQAMPPVPKATADSLRADAETVRGAAKNRGRA